MSLQSDLTTLLKPGEAEVDLVRPHPVTLVPSVGLGAFLILMDFFLIAWWFRAESWGILGFILVLIFGSVWMARGIYEWTHNVLLITTQRIIDVSQRGFFRRTVAEASYDKIQDVRYSINGIWQTMFQFGSVVVQTAGTSSTLDISGIHHPQAIQRLITDTQTAAHNTETEHLSAKELVALVERIKQHLGPDEFARFVRKRPDDEI